MVSRVAHVPACPGFCGRILGNNSNSLSGCGPCTWGTRVYLSVCEECDELLSFYDWCYLFFMLILPLLLHCFYVHYYLPKRTSKTHELLEIACCVVESFMAAFLSVLVFPPRLSPKLWGCRKSSLREWYPALYNPVVGFVKQIKCSYEIVFPLYSLPFVFLFFLLVCILILRSMLYSFVLKRNRDAKAYYCALMALPKIALVHALFAGILYNSFPYMLITFSVCSNAFHLAMEGKAPLKEIIKRLCSSPMQIVLLSINMGLLAFAIISIVAAKGSLFGLFALILVPLPPIFYVLTIGLSHPSVLGDS